MTNADEPIEALASAGGETSVLADGVDEQGPYLRLEHRTRHQGRIAGPHWHPDLSERFTLVSGVLTVAIDGQWHTLEPGQSATAAPRQVHQFRNDGEQLVFQHEIRPPGRHRAMFEVMHALDATGRLTRAGLPRNPLALGLLYGLQDGHIVGPPLWLQTLILGGLDHLARRTGYHRRLAQRVGRPRHHWDRADPPVSRGPREGPAWLGAGLPVWVRAARIGQGAWLVGNMYEALVGVPELLADARSHRTTGLLTAGSPVRYYAPLGPIAVGATARVLLESWRTGGDRHLVTATVAGTATTLGLTAYLVRTVNRPLLTGAEPLTATQRQQLVGTWHRVNAVRVGCLLAATAAFSRLTRRYTS